MYRKFDAGFDADGKVMYFKNCVRCDEEMVFRSLQVVDLVDTCPKCLHEIDIEDRPEKNTKEKDDRADM